MYIPKEKGNHHIIVQRWAVFHQKYYIKIITLKYDKTIHNFSDILFQLLKHYRNKIFCLSDKRAN